MRWMLLLLVLVVPAMASGQETVLPKYLVSFQGGVHWFSESDHLDDTAVLGFDTDELNGASLSISGSFRPETQNRFYGVVFDYYKGCSDGTENIAR